MSSFDKNDGMTDEELKELFSGVEAFNQAELRGENIRRLYEPIHNALLIAAKIIVNNYGKKAIAFFTVDPERLGEYYMYDFEITLPATVEQLKKQGDDSAKKRLVGINMGIMALNKHLYALNKVKKEINVLDALKTLQILLSEKTLKVSLDFDAKDGKEYQGKIRTNYYFKDIVLEETLERISESIIDNIIDHELKAREAREAKKKVEQPGKFYEEVINKPVTADSDLPF